MGPLNQRRAAERGFNFIGPFNPGYDAQLEAAGRNPEDHQVALMVPVVVADSTEKAWEIAGPGLEYFVNFYTQRKDVHGEPAPADQAVTADMIRRGEAGIWRAAVGTPDEVTQQLLPLVTGAMGRVTELALQMRQPGMSNENTHRSMRLLADARGSGTHRGVTRHQPRNLSTLQRYAPPSRQVSGLVGYWPSADRVVEVSPLAVAGGLP